MARKSKLELAQVEFNEAMKRCNERINELGTHTDIIYEALNRIQALFDRIRNVPSDKKLEYEKLVEIRCNWKKQVDIIQEDYNSVIKKESALGAGGVGLGVSVAALGPTAAMGVATTFGVASTGTAISALSGATATNAALAWLGGGALAAGGGGMALGSTILGLMGPVGWGIAGLSIVGGGWSLRNKNDKIIAEYQKATKEYHHHEALLSSKIAEVKGLEDDTDENLKILKRYSDCKYPSDFNHFTDDDKFELGQMVRDILSSLRHLNKAVV